MCTFGVLGLSCETPAAPTHDDIKSETLGGPAEGETKGGARKGGAPKGGAQNFALFSPTTIFFLFFSLLGGPFSWTWLVPTCGFFGVEVFWCRGVLGVQVFRGFRGSAGSAGSEAQRFRGSEFRLFKMLEVLGGGFRGFDCGIQFWVRTKNDPKCIVGFDSDTFSEKMLKTTVKLEMRFKAYSSKGVDKNGAKCNKGFGRVTKIFLRFKHGKRWVYKKWSKMQYGFQVHFFSRQQRSPRPQPQHTLHDGGQTCKRLHKRRRKG